MRLRFQIFAIAAFLPPVLLAFCEAIVLILATGASWTLSCCVSAYCNTLVTVQRDRTRAYMNLIGKKRV